MLRDSAEEVDVVSFQKEDHWRQGWGGQGGVRSLRKGFWCQAALETL